MCGLVFLHDARGRAAELERRVQSGNAALHHRGPDEGGDVVVGSAALGSRRLSIIDIAGSHQPMSDAQGRYWLAYNGEIYNYRRLREEFSGRWSFRTGGDTELLLAGLASFGPQFLDRVEGMFAFALWDALPGRLLLGRDRMGKKPLYYRTWANGLAAASELPALRAMTPEEPWREDLESTADYLRYGFQMPGRTAYQEVFEVLPGHCLDWGPGGTPASRSYWSLAPTRFTGTADQAIDAVRETFTQAVESRLVADVEVGAFLSGGIDSSLVVGLMAGPLGKKPKTFTIGFPDKTFDERPFARRVAARFGTEHFEGHYEPFNLARLSELLVNHVGQPFGDPSILPTDFVSNLAARQVKVVLSGDGGDELFGGYQRYAARTLLRWYSRLPRPLRRLAAKSIQMLPEPDAHHSGSLLKKAHLFIEIAHRHEDRGPYVAPAYYSAGEFQQLAPGLGAGSRLAPALPDETALDDLQRMMATDALVYLPQDILLKVDRASMANSLEARAPFLDSRVVKLAFSLPSHAHFRRGKGKALLRAAFRDLLPPEIWNRRKQGFAVPVYEWFRRGPLRDEFLRLAGEAPEFLSRTAIQRLLDEHARGARDHSFRLWHLYVYLSWRSAGFGGRPQPKRS